jgi:uncharacterized protein
VPDATQENARRKFSLRRLIIIAVATYVGVCILVGVFERRLIYFPTRDYDATPSDIGLDYQSVTFMSNDGVNLTGWYVPNEVATRTILFFHGNAGNISHRLTTIQTLHRLGYNVFIFDYRGFGQSDGSPSESGLYADARAALQYLTQTQKQPVERIVFCGRSLGGAVAIELATHHAPRALVVESTFTELADVGRIHYPFLPVKLILRDRFKSIERIGKLTCPKLILHGADDTLIPIELGRKLFDAAAEPKQFIETPGGHNEAGFTYSTEFTDKLGEFLSREGGQ